MKANSLILFSYGMCNLNCVYCTIDKNKYLKEVDDILVQSFIDYEKEYIPRIRKWFDTDSLTDIETWGGEPLTHIERIFPLMDWIVNEYPNFTRFFSSTNFSYDTWVEEILKLFDFFSSYPNREFNVQIQLSIDGPEYINDANRGKGVTKKCFKNLKNLCTALLNKNIPENVHIEFCSKPTLSIDNVEKDLQDRESIISYYNFFDSFFDIIYEVSKVKPNIKFFVGIPNIATPSPITKEIGIKFANMCKLCHEIEKENIFKHFEIITPFAPLPTGDYDNSLNNICTGCGTGFSSIFMMPHGYYVTCHNAFGDLAEGYKAWCKDVERFNDKKVNLDGYFTEITLPYILNEEEYEKYSNVQKYVYENKNKALGTFCLTGVKLLALANQIDKKYLDEEEAINAINKLNVKKIYCIYNNQTINHSTCIPSTDEYKLFLNGALEYL